VSGVPLVRFIHNNELVLFDSALETIQQMASEMNKSKRQIFLRVAIADRNH
jgi:hypothetical protein